MTVYVIVQLKMTDRAAYDRYQARFFDVFRKFRGRLLSADESPTVLEGAWDRDKLVLMSFPDEAAFHAWAEFARISGDRKGPQGRRAGRRAVGEGIFVLIGDHHHAHGPTPYPKLNGTYGAGA